MKALLAALAVVVMTASMASASKPVVRDGSDYNGIAPNGCTIFVHDDDTAALHVNCKRSDTDARVRYRFTRKAGYNGTFKPADVSVDWDRHGGDCTGAGVRWMVPVPRTVRVIIPAGCYAHIVSVTWEQP